MKVFVVPPCVLGSAADRRLRQAVMAAAESWIGRGPCQAVRPVLAFFLQASTPRSEPLPIGPCLPTSLRSNAPEWCRCACTLTSDSLLEHCEPVPRHVARCARRGTRHEAGDTWRRPSPTPSRPLPALAQRACCERREATTHCRVGPQVHRSVRPVEHQNPETEIQNVEVRPIEVCSRSPVPAHPFPETEI